MGAGRPLRYNSSEEMQEIIDQYFKDCEGTVLQDKAGNTVYNKWGMPVIIGEKPPTITGLALALGFNSRQSLLNYQDKEEFVDTIMRAKAKVEEYTESRLFDKDGANGAKFSLTNNFKGWSEKSEVTAVNHNINSEIDESKFFANATEEEIANFESMNFAQIKAIINRK